MYCKALEMTAKVGLQMVVPIGFCIYLGERKISDHIIFSELTFYDSCRIVLN